jgi:putative tryptophan/tyrosine transport system substrate-binding protein
MKRRDFIAAFSSAAIVWPLSSAYAEPERTLALLVPYSESDPAAVGYVKALRDRLAGLGWREGENLKIELRWSADEAARTRAYVKELVELRPAVIVATGPAFAIMREATRTIPIVFALVSDPVGQGFVSSLSHPGGNITGFMLLEFSAGGKFVELLKAIAPDTKRVAVFEDPANPTTPQWWRSIEGAARDFGIEPQQALVRSESEIDAEIAAIARAPHGSFIVPPQAFLSVHRARLIAAAERERLPAVYWNPLFVREGGLASYGVNPGTQFANAATYVDRILKGAKPGDLPVQAPTKFELAINLKTARAQGLTIPEKVIATADEVIE